MTASIIPFPCPAAQVIPITPAPGVIERAIRSVRSNYQGALAGIPAYLRALQAQSRQEGEPVVAQVAQRLLDELRSAAGEVEAPSDVEPTGGDAA